MSGFKQRTFNRTWLTPLCGFMSYVCVFCALNVHCTMKLVTNPLTFCNLTIVQFFWVVSLLFTFCEHTPVRFLLMFALSLSHYSSMCKLYVHGAKSITKFCIYDFKKISVHCGGYIPFELNWFLCLVAVVRATHFSNSAKLHFTFNKNTFKFCIRRI